MQIKYYFIHIIYTWATYVVSLNIFYYLIFSNIAYYYSVDISQFLALSHRRETTN